MRILSPGLIKKLSSDSAEGLLLLQGRAFRIPHLLHVRLVDSPIVCGTSATVGLVDELPIVCGGSGVEQASKP